MNKENDQIVSQDVPQQTYAEKRAARMTAAREIATHSTEEWHRLLAFCGNHCLRCGESKRLTKDHIVPIYQGGSDGIDNLQPLCRECNAAKGPEKIDYRLPNWRDCLGGEFELPEDPNRRRTSPTAPFDKTGSRTGSKGGLARKAKLSADERSAIARKGAKAKWKKRREKITKSIAKKKAAGIPVHTPEVVIVQKEKIKRMPKEFGAAYSVAEQRLAEALKERASALQKLAALKEEIPSLVEIIRALGGQVNPQALAPMVQTNMGLEPPFVAPALSPEVEAPNNIDPALFRTNGAPLPGITAPPVPIIPNTAVGGAMDLDYTPTDDEPRKPNGGGGWQ
jgi:HNH endonuclease